MYRDAKPRLVIGIDEMDKIDPESAKRFLDNIKAIFGMPSCLYLISVSDEALGIYEQRAILGRTAFDSAFDEVVRVEPLDFKSCRQLLRRRIAGMPDSLIAFCQVMSGGVPRDIIRTARAVLNVRARGKKQIADIVIDLVATQENALTRPFAASPARPASAATSLPAGSFAFQVGRHFYATVAEIFGPKLPETIKLLRDHQVDEGPWIDGLAQARNTISVDPEKAWEMIAGCRIARGLSSLDLPDSACDP